jgi:hypothetical protein
VECGFGSGWVRKSKSLPFGFALSKIPTSGKIGQKWGTRFIALAGPIGANPVAHNATGVGHPTFSLHALLT